MYKYRARKRLSRCTTRTEGRAGLPPHLALPHTTPLRYRTAPAIRRYGTFSANTCHHGSERRFTGVAPPRNTYTRLPRDTRRAWKISVPAPALYAQHARLQLSPLSYLPHLLALEGALRAYDGDMRCLPLCAHHAHTCRWAVTLSEGTPLMDRALPPTLMAWLVIPVR